MIRVKQRDITDCGAACLASISSHYQLQIPVSRIRQLASTDKRGTNVLGMIEAATQLGFEAKGVRGPIESISKIPLPAIAHIIVNKSLHHFVVVYKVAKTYLEVMDPGTGQMDKIPIEKFKMEWTGVLILLLPSETFTKKNEKVSNFQRFWFLINPHKTVMVQALFGAVVYTILGLGTSIYVQQLIDKVLPDSNGNLLNLLSIIMILLLTMQFVVGFIKNVFAMKTGQHIDAQLILGYYKHILKLPQRFFDTMRVGEILSRINDAVKIRAFINDIALGITVNLMVIVFSFGLMFTYYWKLALVSLSIIPIYLFLYWISNKINKKYNRKIMEDSAGLETQLVESLNGVSTIKRFGIEEFANLKTELRFVQLLKTLFSSSVKGNWVNSLSDFCSKVFAILILWVGASFVIKQQLTPGELLSFYALMGYLTGPLIALISSNKSMQDALIAADRLFEILDLDQEVNADKIKLTKDQIGNIVFNEVSFRYGSRNQVFTKLSLTIQKGQITALVGESGSGKSTISALIQNLYPLQTGGIKIGQLDVKYIENESLRTLVSVVPQQIDLFAGTILENIALGDFDPNIEKVFSIAHDLGIHEFVETMPEGYQTMLGEHGANLSGGQRQRIALARALYCDPEILILDEATSSLDPIAERYVMRVLQSFHAIGKTVIMIAHRLSTVIHANSIIVLKNGVVMEQGSHSELLENQNAYYELWKYHQGEESNHTSLIEN